MKAVYCYFFPEVRRVLHEVEGTVPDACYLVTARVEEIREAMAGLVDPPLEIPAAPGGSVDLDSLHEPVIDRILQAYEPHVPGLGDFACQYPTSGSSEGLFHLLVKLRTEREPFIYVLEGEYEGYEAQAANIGLTVRKVNPEETEPATLEPGIWFVSNPSARDGNILPDNILSALLDRGHRAVLDLAYVGATAPHRFSVDHEGIVAVVMSFSKPYGVFRSRIGGFAFSRTSVPSLYGNKWFKDILRLLQALVLAERLGPPRIWELYRDVQHQAVEALNVEHGLGLRTSDALLLAHLPAREAERLDRERRALIAPFQRGRGYRFCLTPLFEERESQ